MQKNAKYIGRITFFKYMGITAVILVGMLLLSMQLSPELKRLINRDFINPLLNETVYFSVQIIFALVIAYVVAGKMGEAIINKNKEPFFTSFIGFFKIWFGILIVAMFSEMIPRIIEYGINFKLIGLGILYWLIMGGSVFLSIAIAQGILTAWFIGKDIEKKKNLL